MGFIGKGFTSVARSIWHLIAGGRRFTHKKVRGFAAKTRGKKILEIGSGRDSVEKFFDSSNQFIKSDIDPALGHRIVDVTKMSEREEFDVIICLNVLEHVRDFQSALQNMHRALKKGGVLVINSPMTHPLHDEPNDFWRFTEHGLGAMLGNFEKVKLEHSGMRRLPFSYYIEARKRIGK